LEFVTIAITCPYHAAVKIRESVVFNIIRTGQCFLWSWKKWV